MNGMLDLIDFSVGLLSRTIDLLNVSRRESFRNTLTFAFLFLFFI